MRSIQTLASMTADGTLTAKIPMILSPGEHQVIIVVDEQHRKQAAGDSTEEQRTESAPVTVNPEPLRFSAYPVGLISDDFTFRREDLYGDTI